MNRIRLLPEHVANQIAAGEVIERPASVVKELVENALDAQARRVIVEIQAGGRSLVRVTDDGLGMSRDDALLCLERHATSKIQRAEDLAAIATLGFRGEALPSIASVSRLTLTTRERDADAPAATQILIQGGRIAEVREAGAPSGTCVEVRQIFFNLPARRKFLRTEETEAAHVAHWLTLAALAHPQVGFHYVKDGRTIWQLPPVSPDASTTGDVGLAALRERMRALHGFEEKLLSVDFTAALPEEGDSEEESPPSSAAVFRLWGWMGQPGVSRSSREDQHLFVNRRPVENRGLNFALIEGCHTTLMKGRYPVCCLFLEIDPASVDVNVHPAKREVKFRDERTVRRLTAQAVREALQRFHSGTGQGSVAGASPVAPKADPPLAAGAVDAVGGTGQGRAAVPAPQRPLEQWFEPLAAPMPLFSAPASPKAQAATPARAVPAVGGVTPPPSVVVEQEKAEAVSPTAPLLTVPLRLVGVVGRLYVVFESDRGLVLMDQHAAHERVLFEQMLARLERGDAPSQRLLLAETVELSARDAQFLREHLPVLTRLGVGLAEFGERTFLLDGLPPAVKAPDARRFVLELVDALKAAGRDLNAQRLSEDVITKTVCRHAVKANDPLSGRELENLLHDLRRCAMPYTCPHGRPTLIEMSYRELEKKFGRLGA
jgi:DNA mismatch repair protein MutL